MSVELFDCPTCSHELGAHVDSAARRYRLDGSVELACGHVVGGSDVRD